MIDKERCDEYFGEHTEDYEATSTVSVLMARQNSIQRRLQRYTPVYHREEGRTMGEIHLDRIKSTPIFVLWDPANKSAACTIKSQIKMVVIHRNESNFENPHCHIWNDDPTSRSIAI